MAIFRRERARRGVLSTQYSPSRTEHSLQHTPRRPGLPSGRGSDMVQDAKTICREHHVSREKPCRLRPGRGLMPGGVNSPARAFGGVGGEPLFIERAEGAYLFDLDGNRYIDYIGSWGPMILGHGHPAVVAALEAAVRRGTSFGAPTEAENELAELIIEAVPSIEKVRLVNSGTEATMSAIRLARGYTGRAIDRQVRRQLPRPRRQPAGGGRQLGGHARRAQFARRDRRHRPRHARAALQRRGRRWRPPSPSTAPRIAGGDRRAGGRQHGLRRADAPSSARPCAS